MQLFKKFGMPVLDADELAHRAIEPGQPAYRKVVKFFRNGILRSDRSIDRRKLAELVFRNPRSLQRLSRAVHPPVIRQIRTFLNTFHRSGQRLCAVSVPLLYETGLEKLFDTVLVVKTKQSEVLKRVANSRGMRRGQILARMRAQMPLGEKCRRADFVLTNNGSLGALRRQVRNLVNFLNRF